MPPAQGSHAREVEARSEVLTPPAQVSHAWRSEVPRPQLPTSEAQTSLAQRAEAQTSLVRALRTHDSRLQAPWFPLPLSVLNLSLEPRAPN